MPKFGHFSSKYSKTIVRLKISTFEIGYMRNLVNIRKLKYFGPKGPCLGIWAQHFGKQMSDLRSAPSKWSTHYNPGQNIWNKIEKSSKTGEDKKSLISTFACFLTATAKA